MAEAPGVARDAYRRHDWAAARDGLRKARERGPLPVADVVALGDAAWWLGLVEEALAEYEAAYRLHLREEQPQAAAMLAMNIGFLCFLRQDVAIGAGWISRARRLLQDLPDSVEHGYLLSLEMDEAADGMDLEAAVGLARRVQSVARRFEDQTLHSAGLVGEGVALVRQGRVSDGLSTLDEAMLPVLAGTVSPEWAGNFYCRVMGVCHELADLRRAREWTDATERWCDQFTSAAMFAGICRVHRVQLLVLQGDWSRAEQQAVQVCEELAEMNAGVVAEAHYQRGEIRRLRDDLVGAERAYQRAHRMGRDPQPGHALLRFAQGRVDAALASVRTSLAGQTRDRLARAGLRAAEVEIALGAGDLAAAGRASAELDDIAGRYSSSGLTAAARHARGAVLLAKGQPAEALPVLREAFRTWHALDASYHAARVRVLLAQACLAEGDEDGALLELQAGTSVFRRLGATADAKRAEKLAGRTTLPGGLTAREAEVLALVARGLTNRETAAALVVSEKTVARHLSNIFIKLGLSSRTGAAAYAIEHGLAPRTRG